SGEGHYDVLDEVITELIEDARARGRLDTRPRATAPAGGPPASSALAYPGKLVVDEPSARLLIADTNHHRLLVATMDGRVTDVIGCGRPGADDGPAGEASFQHPQGMAVVDDLVYVADTDNHLIRTVDLAAGVVATLAGTGEQARGLGARGGLALESTLSSPWAWPARTRCGRTSRRRGGSRRGPGPGARDARTARDGSPPSRSPAASP